MGIVNTYQLFQQVLFKLPVRGLLIDTPVKWIFTIFILTLLSLDVCGESFGTPTDNSLQWGNLEAFCPNLIKEILEK